MSNIFNKPLGNFFMASCGVDCFDDLKPQDAAWLMYAVSFMGYDGLLKKTQRTNMALDNLKDAMCLTRSTFDRFWDAVKDRFIFENADGTLSVESHIFKGMQQEINDRLTKAFIAKL